MRAGSKFPPEVGEQSVDGLQNGGPHAGINGTRGEDAGENCRNAALHLHQINNEVKYDTSGPSAVITTDRCKLTPQN